VGFRKAKDAKNMMDEKTVLLLAPVAHFLGAEPILEIIVAYVNDEPSVAKGAALESAGAEPEWRAPVFAALAKEISSLRPSQTSAYIHALKTGYKAEKQAGPQSASLGLRVRKPKFDPSKAQALIRSLRPETTHCSRVPARRRQLG
jgi:hypothetical protein